MPITRRTTTADERQAERREHERQASRTTIEVWHLPTGRHLASGSVAHDEIRLVRDFEGWHLAGNLVLFGIAEPWDTLPIHASGDDDAAKQADDLIRRRWVMAANEGVLAGAVG